MVRDIQKITGHQKERVVIDLCVCVCVCVCLSLSLSLSLSLYLCVSVSVCVSECAMQKRETKSWCATYKNQTAIKDDFNVSRATIIDHIHIAQTLLIVYTCK